MEFPTYDQRWSIKQINITPHIRKLTEQTRRSKGEKERQMLKIFNIHPSLKESSSVKYV